MGIAKDPYLRYRILNNCLNNKSKRYWSLRELVQELESQDFQVDSRTVERDIEVMRHDERLGYKAPIAYDRKQRGYYYTDRNFDIDKLPLTAEDLETLTVANNILQQYRGVQLVKQFEGVMDKLGKMVDHLKRPHEVKVIAFENSRYYKGRDFFDALLHAITQQQPLSITYRKFMGDRDDVHVFHPYFMKEYHERWYVLGYSEARNNVITLGLDRITHIENASIAFRENKSLKPKEYFQYTLGITLGKAPAEEIILWFSALLAPYVKTQHLHHTQKTVSEDENGLVISLKLIPNPELTQLILGYGADVKVLKPESLKEQVRNVLMKALGFY